MILYTIVHPDYVYNDPRNRKSIYEDVQHSKIIEMGKMKLEVVHLGTGLYRINRIISTNPFDYLNPQLQPGKEIKLH
ncbi:MAG: hypothetical protein GX094_02100 [Clostridiales bacterium]|nr:hypothetical protein [Clostridiales bacterium]